MCVGCPIANGSTSGNYEGGRRHRGKKRQRDDRGVRAGGRAGVSERVEAVSMAAATVWREFLAQPVPATRM